MIGGRYRVVRLLSRSERDAVLLVEHVMTEARGVLKALWPYLLGSSELVDRFEFETRLAARLHSEHVLRVLDAGVDNASQMPFVVSEYLPGLTLREHVERYGALEPQAAIDIVQQVARGLARAHGYVDPVSGLSPIVHRDLKPDNLFLHPRESGGTLVKILNFGIAKVLGQSASVSRELRGTPLFMAPEQIRGEQVSPATDVWSLGLLGFYMLSASHYWNSSLRAQVQLSELFEEILNEPLTLPGQRLADRQRSAHWCAALDVWFARAVERDVGARFATIQQAALDFERSALDLLGPGRRPLIDTTQRSATPVSGPVAASPVGSKTSAVPARDPSAASHRTPPWLRLVAALATGLLLLALAATLVWLSRR